MRIIPRFIFIAKKSKPIYSIFMTETKVISLGGSILVPSDINIDIIKQFYSIVDTYLSVNTARRLIIVVGGGGPARMYQKAYRELVSQPQDDMQDWIGITATRLNAQLLAGVFQNYCNDPVVTDPTADFELTGRVLIAAGWKPGFSTDYDAVMLAEKFFSDTIINLSNIKKVYTDDPKTNPEAKPIDTISWNDFRTIVGDEWSPGKNLPFDPVAAKRSAELHLRVIVASGSDIENVNAILAEQPFTGTVIGPD